MLTLPIKKKWYDMILSGEKKEEYRDISPYYAKRFENLFGRIPSDQPKKIRFRNGYSNSSSSLIAECTVSTGYGRTDWGAERTRQYYRLHIEKIIPDIEKATTNEIHTKDIRR